MNLRSSVFAGFFIIIAAFAVAYVFTNPTVLLQTSNVAEHPRTFDSPYLVPIYEGSFGPNGSIDHFRDPGYPFARIAYPQDLPTKQEASFVAKNVMERFGGIPEDAVLTGVYIDYSESHERSNATGTPIIKKIYESTVVQYERQKVNGVPFLGRDFIELELLGNETIRDLWVQWRTHKPAGTACIISASDANERLMQGKFVRIPPDHYLVNVTRVELAYYYGNYTWYNVGVLEDIPVLPVEPVWVFYGNDSAGEMRSIVVPARDSENPASGACTGMNAANAADLHFKIDPPTIVDTSGMVSIDTAKQVVRDFLEQPDAIVEYKGTVVGHTGPYQKYGIRQFFYYDFLVNSTHLRVDKLTGNVVLADFSRLYPKATSNKITLKEAEKIAHDFAERKYPDFYNVNLEFSKIDNQTTGWLSKRNVYRFNLEGFVDIDATYNVIIEVHPETGKILFYEDNGRYYNDYFNGFYSETQVN